VAPWRCLVVQPGTREGVWTRITRITRGEWGCNFYRMLELLMTCDLTTSPRYRRCMNRYPYGASI
jgi:hypothetical protein